MCVCKQMIDTRRWIFCTYKCTQQGYTVFACRKNTNSHTLWYYWWIYVAETFNRQPIPLSNFFLTIYGYLPLWVLFPTLQTSKSFQLITIFSFKQPDKEMLPFSLYCRTDVQRSHLPWWQISHPVSLVDSSVTESVMCIQSVKLTTSGQQRL